MREKIFSKLDDLGIEYKNYEHNAVFTCDDDLGIEIPGKRVKSLILCNKKKTKFFMIVLEDYKRIDSKLLTKYLDESKLSFASGDYLMEKVGVPAGFVSPFALINNEDKDIRVIFDNSIKGEIVGFHPLRNDNTIVLNLDDVLKFMKNEGFEFEFLEM